MDNIFLIIVTILSLYYIYNQTFKNKGCNCGKDNCCEKK
jgi:hypothetical protein